MAVEVLLDEFVIDKKTQFGTVKRSTGMDKVYVKNDQGIWKHCGYLMRESLVFSPILGVPAELVELIGAECSRQKAAEVRAMPSLPVYDEPVQSEDNEDEFEG